MIPLTKLVAFGICETSYLRERAVGVGQMNHVPWASEEPSFGEAAGGRPKTLLKLHRFAWFCNKYAIFQ